MKKVLVVIMFLFSYVLCVGEAGAVFLLINPGAGAAGVGEAQTGKANDAYATYYNPAGLGFLKKNEFVLQHVNWLPGLTDDIFYNFLGFTYYDKGFGTFGGHVIYLDLGEQTGRDAQGNETDNWSSYMTALTGSYGMQLTRNSSIGMSFKIYHQKLASASTEYESGKPYSTDFAFDVGYMKKFGLKNEHQFGLTIQNIGPPIDFIDDGQADPAPTNMRLGLYTQLYSDGINKVHFLFDANKLLVASYTPMDWNGDGLIGNGSEKENNLNKFQMDEYAHTDKWSKAIITSWLDDWYYGGDYDLCEDDCNSGSFSNGYLQSVDYQIGGYYPYSLNIESSPGIPNDEIIYVPNYYLNNESFCDNSNVDCYDVDNDTYIDFIDVPNDGLGPCVGDGTDGSDCDDNNESFPETYYDIQVREDSDGNGTYDTPVSGYENANPETASFEFSSSEYGMYNPFGNLEKGTGDDRTFQQELKEMIYNFGFEWWYTENFAMRFGFIYDEEGKVKNPTFGAGLRFNKYGFDFGYTGGKDTEPRANTTFFSLSVGI